MADFRMMLNTVPSATVDLAVADWPFNDGMIDRENLKMYYEGVREASRILTERGNFVSVHYPQSNRYVTEYAKKKGLYLIDDFIAKSVAKCKSEKEAGKAYVTIYVFSKNPEKRIFNDRAAKVGKLKGKYRGKYFGKDVFISNVWPIAWRNGHGRGDDNVKEAMPKSAVKLILDMYTKEDSEVVDYFGGSGNFPVMCKQRDLVCTCAELNSKHHQIIQKRLSDLSLELVNMAEKAHTKGGSHA